MIWTILFLFLVFALLPFLAWSSHRRVGSSEPVADELPSPRAMAIQTIAVHGTVFALAFLCAQSQGLAVSWYAQIEALPALVALGVLVLSLGIARWEARRPLRPEDVLRKRLRAIGITKLWLLVMVTAAIAEEFAYRGVLYLLLAPTLSPLFAAVLSASLFGLAHFSQGPKGALMSAGFGLAMQLLCHLSGALLLAVVTHFLYDLGASWLGRRLYRSEQTGAAA